MKIILTNGTELSPLAITGGKRYVHGANRDALTFVFPSTVSLETLDGLFTSENCESITIEEDNGAAHIHKGYAVRADLTKTPVEVSGETADTGAVYEDRVTVCMAQRTYMESQLAAMEAKVNSLMGETE